MAARDGRALAGPRDRDRLLAILRRRSVLRGHFVLASGQRSNVYVDCRLTTLCGEAMPLIGRLMLDLILRQGWRPTAVGGLTMGADPVACAIARESQETTSAMDAFVVRKTGKGHGRKRFVEGLASTENVPCVVIDDVCTTGGSTARAVERVRAVGMQVLGACCLVDRQQGAGDTMASVGCDLAALFSLRDLLQD